MSMKCPSCNHEEMHVWWGYEGDINGVFCQKCQKAWYSRKFDGIVRQAIRQISSLMIETHEFPDDACLEEDMDRQLDFCDYVCAGAKEYDDDCFLF